MCQNNKHHKTHIHKFYTNANNICHNEQVMCSSNLHLQENCNLAAGLNYINLYVKCIRFKTNWIKYEHFKKPFSFVWQWQHFLNMKNMRPHFGLGPTFSCRSSVPATPVTVSSWMPHLPPQQQMCLPLPTQTEALTNNMTLNWGTSHNKRSN